MPDRCPDRDPNRRRPDHATREQLRAEHHCAPTVVCKFCGRDADATTAHRHQGGWVGDSCCWDERLRATS